MNEEIMANEIDELKNKVLGLTPDKIMKMSHQATKRIFKDFSKNASKSQIVEKWTETAVTCQLMIVYLLKENKNKAKE